MSKDANAHDEFKEEPYRSIYLRNEFLKTELEKMQISNTEETSNDKFVLGNTNERVPEEKEKSGLRVSNTMRKCSCCSDSDHKIDGSGICDWCFHACDYGTKCSRLKCVSCNRNYPSTYSGVVIKYEDDETDFFCDYTCFQRRMIKTWKEEIISVIKIEADKI